MIKTLAVLTTDKALGALGGSLAVASLGFGVYMNTHGPAPGSFGNSGHFTVFAQLAPHNRPKPAAPAKIAVASMASNNAAPAVDAPAPMSPAIMSPAVSPPATMAMATKNPAKTAPAASDESLDMTATASIPEDRAATSAAADDGEPDAEPMAPAIIDSVTLERAGINSATIAIAGRTRRIRVGDHVPGAGEVLEIRPGRRPLVRTSRGYIVSARQD